MQKTTVYLPDELKRELSVSAQRLQCSEAEILREALQQYLTHTSPPLPDGRWGIAKGGGEPMTAERFDNLLAEGFGDYKQGKQS